MTDKVIQISTKQLQDIYQTVEKNNNSWDAVAWNRYPTAPGHDPDKVGIIRVKSKTPTIKYVLDAQRSGQSAECDVHILCMGGFIPCHRVVLMHFSPLLRDLITENMKDVGVPTEKTPISISLKDFDLPNMEKVLVLLYSGFSSFPITAVRSVMSLLEFLKIENKADPEVATSEDMKKKKPLTRCEYLVEEEMQESEDEEDLLQPYVPEPCTSKAKEKVEQQVKSATVQKENSKEKGEKKTEKLRRSTDISIPSGSVEKEEQPDEFCKVRPGSLLNKEPEPRIQRTLLAKSQSRKCPSTFTEFSKVRPGSLLNREAEPRIHRPPAIQPKRIGKKRGRKKKLTPTKQQRVKATKEPQPSTSKAAVLADQNRDDVNSDYQPDEESIASESEVCSEKEDSELEEEEKAIVKPNLRNRKSCSRRSEPINNLVIDENSTLAERVKTHSRNFDKSPVNTRYPQRQRKSIVNSSLVDVDVDSPGAAENVEEQDRKPTVESEASEEVDDDGPNSEETAEDNGLKCFFCQHVFETENELVEHALELCGQHLGNHFFYPERICKICKTHLPALSHCGLLRHVQDCYMQRGINEAPNQTEQKQEDPNKRESSVEVEIISGSKLYGDEKFPVGNPTVVVEKISDEDIVRFISRIQEGQEIDIPRVHGYRYVKVTPKKEIPDFYPDDTPEQTMERLRQMEEEQAESQLQALERKKQKQAVPVVPTVPPLVLNRARLVEENVVQSKATEMLLKLTVCSCKIPYPTIELTERCLFSHGFKQCFICSEHLSQGTPMENHYRLHHPSQSGEVTCPMCMIPLKYSMVQRHIKSQHLNHLRRESINEYETQNQEAGSSKSISAVSNPGSVTNRRQTGTTSSDEEEFVDHASLTAKVNELLESSKKVGEQSQQGKKILKRLKKLQKKLEKWAPKESAVKAPGQIAKTTQKPNNKRKRPGPKSAVNRQNKRKKITDNENTTTAQSVEPLSSMKRPVEPEAGTSLSMCRSIASFINARMRGQELAAGNTTDSNSTITTTASITTKSSATNVATTSVNNEATAALSANCSSFKEPSPPTIQTAPLTEPVQDITRNCEPSSGEASVDQSTNLEPIKLLGNTEKDASIQVSNRTQQNEVASNLTNAGELGDDASPSGLMILNVTSLSNITDQPEPLNTTQNAVVSNDSTGRELVPIAVARRTSQEHSNQANLINSSRQGTHNTPYMNAIAQIHNPLRSPVQRLAEYVHPQSSSTMRRESTPSNYRPSSYQNNQVVAVMQSHQSTIYSNIQPHNMQPNLPNRMGVPRFGRNVQSQFHHGTSGTETTTQQGDRRYCTSVEVQGSLYHIYQRSEATLPHPGALITIPSRQDFPRILNRPPNIRPGSNMIYPSMTAQPTQAILPRQPFRPTNMTQQAQRLPIVVSVPSAVPDTRGDPLGIGSSFSQNQHIMPTVSTASQLVRTQTNNVTYPVTMNRIPISNTESLTQNVLPTPVRICSGCNRTFQTENVFETHFC